VPLEESGKLQCADLVQACIRIPELPELRVVSGLVLKDKELPTKQ
jgi:hypothetical protein